jgi:hypothetical protein
LWGLSVPFDWEEKLTRSKWPFERGKGLKETRSLWPPQRGVGCKNRTSVKQIIVSSALFACDLFSPSLSDSFIFLTLTRLVVVLKVCKFQICPIHPPLGDFQYPDSDGGGQDMDGKITRLSNQPNWSHLKIHPESTGIVKTILFWCCETVLLGRWPVYRVETH